MYNSRKLLTDNDLAELGILHFIILSIMANLKIRNFHSYRKGIGEFLKLYCNSFGAITPKLHLIEDHMIFLRRWRVGCGLLGEQGAESIHTKFNKLRRTYSNIKNSTKIHQVTLEHHRRIIKVQTLGTDHAIEHIA